MRLEAILFFCTGRCGSNDVKRRLQSCSLKSSVVRVFCFQSWRARCEEQEEGRMWYPKQTQGAEPFVPLLSPHPFDLVTGGKPHGCRREQTRPRVSEHNNTVCLSLLSLSLSVLFFGGRKKDQIWPDYTGHFVIIIWTNRKKEPKWTHFKTLKGGTTKGRFHSFLN